MIYVLFLLAGVCNSSSTVKVGNKVVVIGGGFGGLYSAIKTAEKYPALDVTLIDTKDKFVFLPLLWARRVRAPWCVSPRRGAAVRDAIKKCLVIRQTSKPLANSQKGFLEAHFNGTARLTSHKVPLIRFHFNTLRLLFAGSHHRCHLERTCALSTAASPRSSRGADPGSASRRTLEAHTRGRPRLASGRSRARVGHRELGTRASNGLVRAHGARRSTRSAPPFALRRARERRLSPWPSTRTRFGSWRTAA